MALVAVGIVVTALLGGLMVTRMLRDPEDTRYRDPREIYVSRSALMFPVFPLVALITGHWQGAIFLALFIPAMFWLAKVNRDHHRERQKRAG